MKRGIETTQLQTLACKTQLQFLPLTLGKTFAGHVADQDLKQYAITFRNRLVNGSFTKEKSRDKPTGLQGNMFVPKRVQTKKDSTLVNTIKMTTNLVLKPSQGHFFNLP